MGPQEVHGSGAVWQDSGYSGVREDWPGSGRENAGIWNEGTAF